MPALDEAIEWDFVTLAAWWNLYGLPVLLAVAAVVASLRTWSRPKTSASQESLRTVRRIGQIHCALAAQAEIFLAQQLLSMLSQGIPESHIGLVIGLISAVVQPFLANGLLRRLSFARRLAIVWYTFLSLLAIVVIVWRWYYQVPFDPPAWPEMFVLRIMPFFLLAVMLLPRIKRVFAKGARVEPPTAQASNPDEAATLAEVPIRWPVTSVLALLFLIIVCSNLVVDATDWGYRLAFESEPVP